MDFVTTEDLEAPIASVFSALTDFDAFEKMAARRGVQTRRTDGLPGAGAGMAWQLDFRYRGKPRRMTLLLADHQPPEQMRLTGDSRAVAGELLIELIELARNRTRVRVVLQVAPKTIPAKLLVQSLRLARARVNERYEARVRSFLKDLETRLQRA
ncbi:SRPBCC family protein [Plastorhodobacter daqingensis]|uniref:SRPBCC family protein n=1 Tax=Plastorhodobacter daqingensis TaxID=1387281 RepID=A0ABW2UQT9_9RHOB